MATSTPPPTPLPIEGELTPQQLKTFSTGKELKDAGDKLFKSDPKEALKKYHTSLLYFRGLTRTNPVGANQSTDSKPKSKLDEELGKVYSNMSACHLRLSSYERTIETADKALQLNKENYKALFRKAKALGELGFFEKAEPILNDLLTKNSAEASTIKIELESLRAKDRERERKQNQKLRGFLKNKEKIFSDAEDKPSPQIEIVDGPSRIVDEPAPSASIVEIKDE
ncbi:hypothetical protein DFH11DRAFT_863760 [Phellopilus nigrolimitatus]|nr:hypothetical protein DFH11DRAFT_863760 [Phellopilus nigrolimitatus]